MRVAIVGAGNGGQAIAGYLAMQGFDIALYDISESKVEALRKKGCITLCGKICGDGYLSCITNNIEEAIKGAEVIMITTVANAHVSVAQQISPFLEDGQIIVLNPGRTCGAIVFEQELQKMNTLKRYYLAEAQTLVYACRLITNGIVNVIGIKDEVFLSTLPATDIDYVLQKLHLMYTSFKKVPNVLFTSLENIGAMFHPCVCLFNAATIERKDEFWFYRDMTEQIAQFIMKFDAERLAVGKAYGLDLINVNDWIKVAYKDSIGDTLCERMRNNPAYYDIKAPGSIFTRQLTEDIPTGVLPIAELGRAAGVETPLLYSMIYMCEALLSMDFCSNGRSLKNLGLEGKSQREILNFISDGK